jgi:8-amino-7-oxononanoate synthase
MSKSIAERLSQKIFQLKQAGLYRKTEVLKTRSHTLNFSSNDYLSLRNDPSIQKAFQKGYASYPAGAGASMLISGYHEIHQTFEIWMAKQLGVDKAIICSSGFTANLCVMALFADLELHFLVDKAVHASLYDGIKLADGKYTRFLHQNRKSLEQKIPLHANNQVLVTEAIFSMSGHASDLRGLADLANRHNTILFVDEAHAFGIQGPQGLGGVVGAGITQKDVPLRMISFGKAIGAQGAVIAGDADWIDALIQVSRPYIYSTGMSPALTAGLMESVAIVLEADGRREKLWQLVAHFRKKVKDAPLPQPLRWRDSTTPIQQLQIGCPHKALEYGEKLKNAGIYCLPMRSPTVNLQETGLRVVLNYHHSFEDIDQLFLALRVISDS